MIFQSRNINSQIEQICSHNLFCKWGILDKVEKPENVEGNEENVLVGDTG